MVKEVFEHIKEIERIIAHLKEEHCFDFHKQGNKINLPISIFDNINLSPSETIIKYLRENLGYDYNTISSVLNRDYQSVYTTYKRTLKKLNGRLIPYETKYNIPLILIRDRSLSVSEHIVKHLKEDYNLKYADIAKMLKRDSKTIWTLYKRANEKWTC